MERPCASLAGGAWLEKDRSVSVEGGFFSLADATRQFTFAGGTDGTPVLGHPFINANTGNENLYIVSAPASVAGIALLGQTTVSAQSWPSLRKASAPKNTRWVSSTVITSS